MTRDAVREGLRATVGPLGVGALASWTLVPGVSGLALGAGARATVDLALLLQWVVVLGAALLLGTRLHGDGLRVYVVPVVGPGRWLAARTLGAAVALGVLVLGLGVASLALGPVRATGAGLGLHLAGLWLEGVVVCQLAGLLRVVARAGVAAWAAASLALVGHLHTALLQAVALWGQQGWVRVVLRALPGFEGVDVQGALIAGRAPDPWAWAWGALALVGWSLLLGGGTLALQSRAARTPL